MQKLFSKEDLRKLIIPLLFEQALAITVGMADTMMISSVGEAAVSGVSLIDMFNNFIMTMLAALATGGAVVTSQFLGAKRQEDASSSAKQLIVSVGLITCVVSAIVMIFNHGIISLLFGKIERDVFDNAVTYLLISALSFPALAIYNSCAALFRSMGNSQITLKVSTLMNFINIAGNAICIYGLKMGVAGVAIPSLISRVVAGIMLLVLLRNPAYPIHIDKEKFSFRWDIIHRILFIGIPSGIEGGIFQLGRVLVVSIIAGFGTVQIAANGVANSLDAMGCIVGQAMSLAMITVIGRCVGASTMLDPAVGNSTFLINSKKQYPECMLTGYEIDSTILDFFGNPAAADIKNEDYLLNGWDETYDAIVCNPPYNRFQSVTNRKDILTTIYENIGVKYSSYTNLYILFLLKSLFQLSSKGRLAYIIPTEFLNSQYGTPIKEKLLNERLLTAIINFENDSEMFFNATTTCCILLVDHSPKENIFFYNLQSISELKKLVIGAGNEHSISISYNQINASDKWRSYLYHEINNSYQNLVDISAFCKVTRGIATGANDYFCMNISKIKELGLPIDAFSECVCRSADVTSTIFTREDFKNLANADKSAYVFDIKTTNDITVKNYIAKGEVDGISKKSLPAARNPWHSMEHRPIAPIWVSTACRNGLKFVRNLAEVKALTTFHSVYIHKEYESLTNIIFCYFLTPIAQEIIRGNRKELGNGLEKFQPNDINSAKMLDITKLSPADYNAINSIYKNMLNCFDDKYISKLNDIFSKHML